MASIYPFVITVIFVLETILVFGTDLVPTTPPQPSSSPSEVLDNCAEVNLKLNFTNSTDAVFQSCSECVKTTYDNDKNMTLGCLFFETSSQKPNYFCGTASQIAEGTTNKTDSINECGSKYHPKPIATSTTTPPATLPPIPTKTPAESNTSSTTVEPPVTIPSTVTPENVTSTTTPAPAGKTTTTTPTSEPSSESSFSFANFLGGIVFTLAVSSLAYVVWKFYKARTERNYHTF